MNYTLSTMKIIFSNCKNFFIHFTHCIAWLHSSITIPWNFIWVATKLKIIAFVCRMNISVAVTLSCFVIMVDLINQWCWKISLSMPLYSQINFIIFLPTFLFWGQMVLWDHQATSVWCISIFETTNQFSQNFVSTGKDEDGPIIINNGKCKI